ncbi:hypothetical protein CAEBREN_25213 [Caenorhabditis brenneri]|uniref:Uncharacterized protein n=1 Tax=Caenorhabditis brenneri TaxID=135651 RepID=G0NPL0_CAEBE|nr:hypothetical protein CAEBREN_25213 [Caenorhabditis brenneri]
MGGGSALLINSNRRGAGGGEFGCEGWFCDILDGAMMLLVVMIIATAIIGCLKTCFYRRQKCLAQQEMEPKSVSEQQPSVAPPPESDAPPPHLPVVIVMENPPDYMENDMYLPPAYCTLRFDQTQQEGAQI